MDSMLFGVIVFLLYILCFLANMGLATAYVSRRNPLIHYGQNSSKESAASASYIIIASLSGPFSLPIILIRNFSYEGRSYGFTFNLQENNSRWIARRNRHEVALSNRRLNYFGDLIARERRHRRDRAKNQADGECISIWECHKRKRNDGA